MANPMYWRLLVLLAKIETTYGVDPTLTGAANGILAKNVSIRPMEGEDVSRELIQSYMGAQPTIPTGLRVVIEFETELAGSGAAGTAPPWGPLMRGCAFAETIAPATSVAYSPLSNGATMESLYLKFWVDGIVHAIKGARGDATLTANAQGIPVIRWTFTGLYVAPADVARPTPTLTAFQKPLIATKVNTPTYTLNAVAMVMRAFSLKFGNKVEPRLLVGREEILITDRAESIDTTVEAVPIATLDVYGLALAQTQVAASLVHGTVAGNIVTIGAPRCQIKRPTGYQQNQGIAEMALNLTPLPSTAGNDQISLTLT